MPQFTSSKKGHKSSRTDSARSKKIPVKQKKTTIKNSKLPSNQLNKRRATDKKLLVRQSPNRKKLVRRPNSNTSIYNKQKPSIRKQPSIKNTNQVKIARPPTQNYDFSILFVVFLLVLFGIVMIFSSSYYNALLNFNDMYYFLKRQALWAAIGIGALIFMMNFDYHRLKYLSRTLYIVSTICLILVLFIGIEVNGSRRWLGYGFIRFQPSELAKIAIIVFISTLLSENKSLLKTFRGFILTMIFIFLPVALIALKNLSTAIVAAFVGVVIVFLATPKIWYFFPMALPIIPAFILMVTRPEFLYRMDRITAWLDPFSDPTDTGFQTVQSLFAVASGGIFGLGLGQSRQKLGYIPEAYNDIIFSIICEELGLVGAITLILLFVLLVYRGIRIALNAQDLYGCLLSSGIIGMIAIQVLINIAVVTNTMPVTGMPLPFISYGGSSLAILLGSIGILLNISKYTK